MYGIKDIKFDKTDGKFQSKSFVLPRRLPGQHKLKVNVPLSNIKIV